MNSPMLSSKLASLETKVFEYIGSGIQFFDKQQYQRLKHCGWLGNNNYHNLKMCGKMMVSTS